METRDFLATEAGRLLGELRTSRPLVQCITNFVAMDVSANVLLALGASPAMVHAPEESAEFVTRADALLCNIGTLSPAWLESMEVAGTAAHAHGKPWVLDPVGAGATRLRDTAVQRLLRHRPAVVRGNASEIMAVARAAGLTAGAAAPKGVDSANTTQEAADLARRLARQTFGIVAATGEIDFVTDGERDLRLANGVPLMARVTALGCALSAVVAAFLALSDDALVATACALALYGIAGEIAHEQADRPGSFRTAFIDALDAIDAPTIEARLRIA